MKKAIPWALGVFLVAFGVFAFNNYRCRVDSDPSTYLKFAESLARGSYFIEYPPDRVYRDFYPPAAIYRATHTTLVAGGKAISFVAIGYPLFLALFVGLGGKFAPFFANGLVFLAFFGVLYLFVVRLFRSHPDARLIGLIAVLLYFLDNRVEIKALLDCYRDPLSYTLLLGAFVFFLDYFQPEQRLRDAALAGVLFGLAVAVRETSALAAVPMGVMFLREYLPRRRPPLVKSLAVFALWAAVGAGPLFVQNAVNTGNPLHPTQLLVSDLKRNNRDGDDVQREIDVAGLRAGNFSRTAPKLLGEVREKYGPVLIGVAILGLWLGRAVPGVMFFAVPFIACYLLLYGFYVSSRWRYVFVIHMMVMPVVAYGFVAIGRWAGGLLRFRAITALGTAGIFLYALGSALSAAPPGDFKMPQAAKFQRDFEAAVPRGAVVLAERPMRSVIDYFTHAYGVRPGDYERPRRGLTLETALRHLRGSAGGIYFFDSAAFDQREGYARSEVTEQRLLEHSDLKAAATFAATGYEMRSFFGKDAATVYEVGEWSGVVVEREIPAVPGRESLLRINARRILDGAPARGRLDLLLDGRLVSSAVTNGVNYFRIPSGWIGGPTAVVRMVSDAPLPGNVEPALIGLEEFLPVDIGPAAVPLDSSVLSEEFFRSPGERAVRFLAGDGTVSLPTAVVPGTTLMVLMAYEFDHDGKSAQTRLGFAFDGREQASLVVQAGGGWRTICFPLGRDFPSNRVVSEMTVRSGLGGSAPASGKPPREYLAIDRFGVFRYDHARPVPAIDFGVDDEMYVRSGLYRGEIHLGRHSVRYTDGNAHVNLPCAVSAAGRAAKIRLQVWGPPASLPAPRCRMVLNGKSLGEFAVAPAVVQTFTFDVPAGALREGINDVQIISPTWRPAKSSDPGDSRVLGIMLDRLEIEPEGDG